MTKCAGCLKTTKEANSIHCALTACEKVFCSKCIPVSSLTVEQKKCWKCPECCAAQKKGGDNTFTPVKQGTEVQGITTRKKAESVTENSGDIKQLTEKILTLTEKLEEVTQSLTLSQQRMDDLVTTIKANEARMKNLEKRVEEVFILKSQVSKLQNELNIQSQNKLLNEIEIIGIPESSAESLQHCVQLAARKIGVDLEETDVDWITRVGPRRPAMIEKGNKLPRPVVVRLLRKSKRDQLLKAAKARRNITTADMGIAGETQKIFFNERLTKENRMLFRDARNRAKKEGFSFCWCQQGSIYVRQREGKPALLLRLPSDLDHIFVNTIEKDDETHAGLQISE